MVKDQWEPMLVLNSTPITPITHQPLQSRNYGVLKPDIFTDPEKGEKLILVAGEEAEREDTKCEGF